MRHRRAVQIRSPNTSPQISLPKSPAFRHAAERIPPRRGKPDPMLAPRYRLRRCARADLRFQVLNRSLVVLTIFRTRRCMSFVKFTVMMQSRRIRFSTTFTVFCTHLVIEKNSQTICPRKYRASLSHPIFRLSRKRGERLANYISAMSDVNGIRLRSYSHMRGNRR